MMVMEYYCRQYHPLCILVQLVVESFLTKNLVFRFYYHKTIHKYEAYKSFDFNIILFQDVDSPLSKFG